MIAFKANTAAPLQEQIADHLAHRIVSGELPDKSRLPSTVELARLYHVTPVTIHKSLQHLVQRQLIERQPRRGTFVRSRERVNVIALVFGKNPFRDRSHLYSQLLDEFQKQSLERALNLKIYFDFESGSRTMFDLEPGPHQRRTQGDHRQQPDPEADRVPRAAPRSRMVRTVPYRPARLGEEGRRIPDRARLPQYRGRVDDAGGAAVSEFPRGFPLRAAGRDGGRGRNRRRRPGVPLGAEGDRRLREGQAPARRRKPAPMRFW